MNPEWISAAGGVLTALAALVGGWAALRGLGAWRSELVGRRKTSRMLDQVREAPVALGRRSKSYIRQGSSRPPLWRPSPYPRPNGSAWVGWSASYLRRELREIRTIWRQVGRKKARFWIRSTTPSAMESRAPVRASPKVKAHLSALNAEMISRRGDERPYPA